MKPVVVIANRPCLPLPQPTPVRPCLGPSAPVAVRWASAWAVCAALASPAWAADALAPVPAGAVPTLDELRPPVPLAKEAPVEAAPELPPVRELGKPLDDIFVDVRGYRVDGSAPPELQAALAELTAPFVGPQRSFEDLMNAVAAVTRYLQRDLGLYLGYAYLPEQVPEDGMVRIGVLEGKLDEVILNWRDDIPVDKGVVQDYLARLKPGSVLRVREVERVVFLINDLRGLTARFEVRQGRTPGTASLVVTPSPEKTVSGKTELDGNGSRFSGLYRLSATASVGGPLQRGDSLVLSGQVTSAGGLQFVLGGYTVPMGSNGLKAGLTLSKVQYQLSSEVPLQLQGEATAASVYMLFPWVRSRNLNLFVQGSLEQREFIDRKGALGSAADAVKRATELRTGVAGDFRDNWLLGGVSTFEASLTGSRLNYRQNGPALSLLDPANRVRLNWGFSRLNTVVRNRLLAYVNVTGQRAWQNLDTTEQYSIGGPGRVRAYAPGEGSADEGRSMALELRFLPPDTLLGRYARETVFSAFYDVAHVRFKHDASRQVPGFAEAATYSGYGIGATWERPRVLSANLSLAWPLLGTAQNDTVPRVPRVYASLMRPF